MLLKSIQHWYASWNNLNTACLIGITAESACTYHANLKLSARCWSAEVKCFKKSKKIPGAGAAQVGFFTPCETKWPCVWPACTGFLTMLFMGLSVFRQPANRRRLPVATLTTIKLHQISLKATNKTKQENIGGEEVKTIEMKMYKI